MQSIPTVTADLAAASALLHRYARFEGDNTPPATPPAPDTPPAPKGGTAEDKKFTQADLDKHAGDRAERAAEAARKKLLADLGIDDPDKDKELLARAKKQQQDDLSIAEKAEIARQNAEDEKAVLREQLDGVIAERAHDQRAGAVKAAAQKSGAIDPADVVAWAEANDAKGFEALLKSDGSLDDKQVGSLVEAVKKAKPHFFRRGGMGSPSNNNGKIEPSDVTRIVGEKPFGSL